MDDQNPWVREQLERTPLRVRGPARMPTPVERREFALDDGVPVLVVMRGGKAEVLPGDRTELELP